MRTTVTLDADVEGLLRNAVQVRGLAPARPARRRRFVQKTYSLGADEAFQCGKALALADALKDEEIVRKMSGSQ